MKYVIAVIAMLVVAQAASATDLRVSVQVGQPGFYGRIDIGDVPQPKIVNVQPVVIQPPPARVVAQPVYLVVPPEHSMKWDKHCHKYNACSQQVYFVEEGWYNEVYVPKYKERKLKHKGKQEKGPGDGKPGKQRGKD